MSRKPTGKKTLRRSFTEANRVSAFETFWPIFDEIRERLNQNRAIDATEVLNWKQQLDPLQLHRVLANWQEVLINFTTKSPQFSEVRKAVDSSDVFHHRRSTIICLAAVSSHTILASVLLNQLDLMQMAFRSIE